MNYPTGTVTFLFTDVEGSTALWEHAADEMLVAMARHDGLIDAAAAAHDGLVVRPRGEGDSRFLVFEQPAGAIRAAHAIQRDLAAAFTNPALPIRVRIGLNTGAADWRDGDYYGSAVNRCARIRGLGHGGQILLSQATAELVRDDLPEGVTLLDLGTHQLKGLSRPETIYQLWLPDLPNEFPPLQSPASSATNLPEPPTSIIGRERERDEVASLLAQDGIRLVTLSGPGGTGKTRLSLELGHSLLEQYPDGVTFVDLAPISDPALVASTIAHAMGIREGGGRPPFDNLKDFLANRQLLIILDNMEQVVAAAPIIAGLLGSAPKVKVIATSRIPLQIRGEREYPLPTLPVPPDTKGLALDELLDYEAVRLFVRQAQTVRPAFELTPDNAATVVAICRRLDGLPLALEIAAARIRLLPPAALLKRLDQSLSLLVGGAADLPTRQQTMRGTIDWSYDLLQPEEQTLFARLGVFVGGFTLETAEAVCNHDGALDVFSSLEVLLSNSLVRQVESNTDEPRFDMLQTIRDYALERLEEAGALAEMRGRHAEYYYQYSIENWHAIYGSEAMRLLAQVEDEHDNFRTAMSWGLEPGNDLMVASQISILLIWFWYRHGHLQEGREWAERIMRATEAIGGIPHGMGLNAAGMMAMWLGDHDIADDRISQALSLAEEAGFDLGIAMGNFSYGVNLINQGRDRQGYTHLVQAAERFDTWQSDWDTCNTLIHLANASLGLGELDMAETWLNQAMALAEKVGDPWQIAFYLNNFGEVARTRGDYDSARDYYTRSEQMYRKADAPGDHARLVHTLGYLALHDGNLSEADKLFRESLAAFRKLGNKRGMAECLAGLAAIAAKQGDFAHGTLLLGAAEAQLVASHAVWWPADRGELEHSKQALATGLGETDYHHLWERGQAMTLEDAVALVTDLSPAPRL